MDPAKEIELIILDRIVHKGVVTDKDFDHLFEDKNFEYNLALSRIIKNHRDRIPEISGEYAELRRGVLLRERNVEEAAGEIKGSLIKHEVIVKTSTRFLVIVSLITFLTAIFLIRLDSKIHPIPGPKYRAVISR
jgi:hypothetical protein